MMSETNIKSNQEIAVKKKNGKGIKGAREGRKDRRPTRASLHVSLSWLPGQVLPLWELCRLARVSFYLAYKTLSAVCTA